MNCNEAPNTGRPGKRATTRQKRQAGTPVSSSKAAPGKQARPTPAEYSKAFALFAAQQGPEARRMLSLWLYAGQRYEHAIKLWPPREPRRKNPTERKNR
jgi:hypothetical protein